MKLQKQLSCKVGNIEYAKWVITLPPETIKEIGWKEGIQLKLNIKDGKIIIQKE